jgi:hypothetical protein
MASTAKPVHSIREVGIREAPAFGNALSWKQAAASGAQGKAWRSGVIGFSVGLNRCPGDAGFSAFLRAHHGQRAAIATSREIPGILRRCPSMEGTPLPAASRTLPAAPSYRRNGAANDAAPLRMSRSGSSRARPAPLTRSRGGGAIHGAGRSSAPAFGPRLKILMSMFEMAYQPKRPAQTTRGSLGRRAHQ